MADSFGKKLLCHIFLAYLILAVPGSFVFSMGESFYIDSLNKKSLGADVFFSSMSHAVDWLSEDAAVIGKAYRYSNSRLRYGLLRAFASVGICIATVYFARSCLQAIKKDNSFIAKSDIPLKLLI